MGALQWWKMMEQVAGNKRGQRAMEWMRDDWRQQINNQPLMGVGVAKAGGDTAVNAKAALVVNEAFRHCVDHGGGRKVCANGREAVDNRHQWQQRQQSTKSDGGKWWCWLPWRWRWVMATVVDGNWQQDANGQGDCWCASYPLVVIVGWGFWRSLAEISLYSLFY